jgi:hypothetical protein
MLQRHLRLDDPRGLKESFLRYAGGATKELLESLRKEAEQYRQHTEDIRKQLQEEKKKGPKHWKNWEKKAGSALRQELNRALQVRGKCNRYVRILQGLSTNFSSCVLELPSGFSSNPSMQKFLNSRTSDEHRDNVKQTFKKVKKENNTLLRPPPGQKTNTPKIIKSDDGGEYFATQCEELHYEALREIRKQLRKDWKKFSDNE